MATSIVERVIGSPDPYTTNYLAANLRLARSITIKSSIEAHKYNELVEQKYKIIENEYRPEEWRYFKHLSGQYHRVDVPMTMISYDNRKEIVLTLETINMHIETKRELCKYGELYDNMIKRYPEQRLLLRTLMSSNNMPPIKEIIELPEWSIVAWDNTLVEPQEINLMDQLRKRILNYSCYNMITHYQLTDDLFLGCLYVNLYNMIFTSLLGIRLRNSNTGKVHSYHMLNYFASHHGIDLVYDSLDTYQRLYLYRNLLYLDCHAAMNETFDELVELLMTRKRITIVNYVYKQENVLRKSFTSDYKYYQKLLNNENFVYDRKPFDYEMLADKERLILEKNAKEYQFNMKGIDDHMVHTSNAEINTKDLEINLRDDTNNVSYRLLDVLTDYWAATIELGYNQALVEYTDPTTGDVLELVAKDAYKLFTVALHFSLGIKIETIPDYWCWNIFKEEMPSDEELLSVVGNPIHHIKEEVIRIATETPKYRQMDTNRAFREFVENVFRFELGMWMYISSTHDLYSKTNIVEGYSYMRRKLIVSNDDENVQDFLVRIGLPDMMNFNEAEAQLALDTIIRMSTEDIMELADINRLTQEAATYVLSKFKSFTTQVLSIYNSNDIRMAGLVHPRTSLVFIDDSSVYPVETISSAFCVEIETCGEYDVDNSIGIDYASEEHNTFFVESGVDIVGMCSEKDEYVIDNSQDICITMTVTPNNEVTDEQLMNYFKHKGE